MKSVADIAKEIVQREGGFVNDPDDPGGATKYGVTLGTLKRVRRDKNADGRVDIADLHRLTPQDAADIFITYYFDQPGIAKLPQAVQASVFDMFVNAGATAVTLLQRLLSAFGNPVTVDGQIGPETIDAAADVARIAPQHFNDAYGIERRNYYYRLGDQRPRLRKFARRRDGLKGGWIKRAEEFMAPRYHLSAAEHRERVSSWDG